MWSFSFLVTALINIKKGSLSEMHLSLWQSNILHGHSIPERNQQITGFSIVVLNEKTNAFYSLINKIAHNSLQKNLC